MSICVVRSLALAAGLFCVASAAVAQGASTYQDSCGDIHVIGGNLVAICRRMDGSLRRTSINLQGIQNIDGQLQFTRPDQPASFQVTCHHVHVTGGMMTAACRRMDGSFQQTSVNLPAISNIDGHLQYDAMP